MNDPQEILERVFGYDAFRPPQKDIIDTILDGGDALVLMPTGGGKSLCYQIPSLARPGCGGQTPAAPLAGGSCGSVTNRRARRRLDQHGR